MVKLILDDDEARVLQELLVERTNLPTKFRHSPMQEAYRSILEKLDQAEGEAPQSKGRRARAPHNLPSREMARMGHENIPAPRRTR
jgi:hypothetical protein